MVADSTHHYDDDNHNSRPQSDSLLLRNTQETRELRDFTQERPLQQHQRTEPTIRQLLHSTEASILPLQWIQVLTNSEQIHVHLHQ